MVDQDGKAGPSDTWAISVPIGYRIGPWRVTAPIATGSWGSVNADLALLPARRVRRGA
jgi:hypothetical protein